MFLSVLNVCLLVAVVAIGGGEAAGATWNYSAAENWKDTYPACGNKQQTPININRFYVKTGVFNPIAFQNYDVLPEKQTVTNDGHTLKVEITQTSKMPYIEWSVFLFTTVKYNFAQYHLHWGSKSTQGSEHTVDTVRYPMELHLVHFNNKYADLATAAPKPDGLAVLGIFFVISKYDNPALAPLLAAIKQVDSDGTADPAYVVATNMYALSSLLPTNTKRFFRYAGSLTTPPCFESVLWTVFEEPIPISEAQIEGFRAIKGLTGKSSDNFRPIQALNNRKVEKSWKD